jgi:hypothetical protein
MMEHPQNEGVAEPDEAAKLRTHLQTAWRSHDLVSESPTTTCSSPCCRSTEKSSQPSGRKWSGCENLQTDGPL